eukprot:Gregarina_sp_Poly_1__843@NODE_11_length_23386_cov_122_075861_g9_i0_p4_GENE_NODE_11_length_23386_cov_122_075861_g9_i0NODE_11_length_23386_cov_122_075861_g9_i0_p4_ORF_typecomplete_len910_score125_47Lipase_3/PF01764_25/1_8e24Hydrolase_4/PF12146_8/5_3e03Hydrolase_4/PF12146_8/0_00048DUF2974/PF11187_8/0_00075Chlorophyllase/PF07224_11/0_0016Chlorophyllase2/PF12740_7/0_01Abhydrolase_6/PF12697_7/5e03Abhydrolase_6/PF12697_7/0_044Abhydrolase_6/PF12697_7/1_2e04UPF0227/PF05728_12/0_22DUF3349/PF11829_8/1_5e04
MNHWCLILDNRDKYTHPFFHRRQPKVQYYGGTLHDTSWHIHHWYILYPAPGPCKCRTSCALSATSRQFFYSSPFCHVSRLDSNGGSKKILDMSKVKFPPSLDNSPLACDSDTVAALDSPLRLRRSLPVAQQSFFTLPSCDGSSSGSDVASNVRRTTGVVSADYADRGTKLSTYVSLFGSNPSTAAPESVDLSSWHPDWGPGRKLRNHGLRNLGRRRLWAEKTRPNGGFVEALRTLRRVSKPLRAQKIRHLMKASRALGSLQEAASDPYPPHNLSAVDVNTSGGRLLLEEIRFFFGVCLSVYPAAHVVKHYGLKLQAQTMPESVREFLCGRAKSGTDDIVVIDYLDKSEVHRPAYCLVVDHIRCFIFLIIRGSVQFSDVATDVQCEIIQETRTHDGMERAAGWFDHHLRDIVCLLCNSHPTYQVALCGHSLGGGVASLLAMKWLCVTAIAGPPPERNKLKAYSFGAPAICTADIAASFKNHIWSVTNGRDIISRLSFGSVQNMTKLLLAICEHSTKSREMQKQMREARRQTVSDQSLFSTQNLMAAVADVHDKVEQIVRDAEDAINLRFGGESSRKRSIEAGEVKLAFSENVENDSASAGSSPKYGARFVKHMTEVYGDFYDASAWIRRQFGPGGIRKEREPLLQLLNRMRELFEEDERTILTPAGRWFMSIPAAHFVIAGRPPPVNLMPGGFALFDASPVRTDICREMVFRRRAVHDHYPQFIGFSIGSGLELSLPDEIAMEMEQALSVMGLDFKVRPGWKMSNMSHFRYRHLKQRQTSWIENDNPGTVPTKHYFPLLTKYNRDLQRTPSPRPMQTLMPPAMTAVVSHPAPSKAHAMTIVIPVDTEKSENKDKMASINSGDRHIHFKPEVEKSPAECEVALSSTTATADTVLRTLPSGCLAGCKRRSRA